MTTLILRHRRENLKKCSLKGLETHPYLKFFTYPKDALPDLSNCILLKVGAEELTQKDQDKDLLIIDGTWRLASVMEKTLPIKPITRSLPSGFKTAYPRRQPDCIDPTSGLASVEALYLAHLITNKPLDNLLDWYFWKDDFIKLNNL